MLLIDDYLGLTWVAVLREKLEVLEKSKIFKAKVENEVDKKASVQDLIEESSLPMNFALSVRNMVVKDNYLPLEHHSKMVQ